MSETQAPYLAAPLVAPIPAETMTEWERRLVVHARLLRAQHKSCMILVRFDGPVMTLWRVSPDGRME